MYNFEEKFDYGLYPFVIGCLIDLNDGLKNEL